MAERFKTGAARGLYAAAAILFLFAFLPQAIGPGGALFKLWFSFFGTAAVTAAGVLRFRVHPDQKRRIARQSLWILFAVYLLILIRLVLFDSRGAVIGAGIDWRNANLIPFATIRFYLSRLPSGVAVINLAGNLAAFMPCGLFVPLLFRRLDRIGWFLLAVVLSVAAVEMIQLATNLGACDVDDLILNTAGAAAAYGICHLPPLKRLFVRLGVRNAAGL